MSNFQIVSFCFVIILYISNFKVSANVQNDYKTKTNNLEITQASVFVKNSADIDKVSGFLSLLSSEINTLLDDPENVLNNATKDLEPQFVSGKIGGTVAVVSNLLKNNNQLGLGYKDAKTNKDSIDNFISTLGLPASKEGDYFTPTEPVETYSNIDIKVACPAGAPATSLYNHLNETENIEIAAADTVLAYLSNNSNKDVVIAPTNAGLAAINRGAEFKIAATITFGNFFIVSTGHDKNGTMDKGDKVLAFQENGVAGKMFNYIYGDRELNITYVADVNEAKSIILTQK